MSQISSAFGTLPDPLENRLSALSSSHSLTPLQLYESWEAYSLTRGVETLDDITFLSFETHVKSAHNRGKGTVLHNTALGKRASLNAGVTPSPAPKRDRSGLSAVDSLDAVSTPSKQRTEASPSSVAATVTPHKGGYSDRQGRNTVVASYNPSNFDDVKGDGKRKCVILNHPLSKPAEERHGFAPLVSRAKSLEDRWLRMNDALCESFSLKSEDEMMVESERGDVQEEKAYWTPVGVPGQSGVVCVGRVCNEAHEGRLNSSSLLLEGSRHHSSGSRISLDLPKDLSYSLFPGQIVAMEGMNSSGRCLRPIQVMEGAPPPKETSTVAELTKAYQAQDGRPIKIVSMCGPYTTSDNLEYTPLVDAVLKISEEKPDVVILCGPFVDSRHSLVEECLIEEDGIQKKVSHEHLFRIRISDLFAEMYENDPSLDTQIVLVPSVEDAFLDSVYPQPPIRNVKTDMVEFGSLGLKDVETAGRETNAHDKRVHCVSNPSTLKINEVVIGVTSTDVLFHINCDSTSANLPPSGRLARMAQHLIQQRSYYPLFPAAKGACLDLTKQEQWEMPVQPDILIVPSKLNPFVKEVLDSTVVVNPGALTKNTNGGTFAVIDVHPMKRERLEGDAMESEFENSVRERVRVDIKRI